ncbi:hypothetical protein I5Q34_02630 [Streptomyces sp. AV19]|nr:DUF6879 family protein [Streptomyces sp. AV19]MBH1933192.1 hypothetical protein [Streptomyces sp. AV19]
MRFNHFTGDGDGAGFEYVEDKAVIKLCADAFAAVWERGVPHEEFKV